MKQAVKKFRSLAICLKELEPFITDGQHLLTGKPLEKMHGMRSREILGNWLCCIAINSFTQPDRLAFTSDPSGGDGVIIDTTTDEIWPVEHIMIPAAKPGDNLSIENLIAAAIQKKQEKGGSAYASGKTLIIFLNAGLGEWFPNRIARALPTPLLFEAAWVWGFEKLTNDGYTYNVCRLDVTRGNAPCWRVHIASDFNSWRVEIIQ